MDTSGFILPQKAILSGHVKFQIHCVKEHQVTDVLLLSFHRKFRALLISSFPMGLAMDQQAVEDDGVCGAAPNVASQVARRH